MPPKAVCWNKQAQTELEKQFNLFTTTNGDEGFDPENQMAEYIKAAAQNNEVLCVYLAGNLGGNKTNKDSSKLL